VNVMVATCVPVDRGIRSFWETVGWHYVMYELP